PTNETGNNKGASVQENEHKISNNTIHLSEEVTCDDDAILDYLETRVGTIEARLGDLVDWLVEYCTVSRRDASGRLGPCDTTQHSGTEESFNSQSIQTELPCLVQNQLERASHDH